MGTPFDNSISKLYRYAVEIDFPPDLILTFVADDGAIELVPLDTYFDENIDELFEILVDRLVRGDEPPFTGYFKDFVTVYFDRMLKRGAREEIVRKQVNAVLDAEDNSLVITGPRDLEVRFESFDNDIDERMKQTHEKLRQIDEIELELSQYRPLPSSEFFPENLTRRYTPVWREERPIPDSYDALEIFNRVKVSAEVPYVLYVQTFDRRLYKIYENATIENIQVTNRDIKFYDTIYFTIWMGVDETIRETREGYVFAYYRLGLNSFFVPGPILYFPRILERINQALPFLNLGDGVDVSSTGRIYFYDVTFSERSFSYAILNEPTIANYLYIEEFLKPFAVKKDIKVRYKSLADIRYEEIDVSSIRSSMDVAINWGMSSRDMGLTYEDGSVVPDDIPYIACLVTRAETRGMIDEFTNIFRRLMSIYEVKRPEIESIYNGIIDPDAPENQTYVALLAERESPYTPFQGGIQTPLGRLKFQAPEIFRERYARICQPSNKSNSQPKIVSDREAEEWKAAGFDVMNFEGYNFVCPMEAAPYPGLTLNKLMINRDRYPYVPCCFKSNQIETTKPTKTRIYLGEVSEDALDSYDAKKPLRTSKAGKYLQRGKLPEGIGDTLKTILGEIFRIGMDESPSSFLEAALFINKNRRFIQSKNRRERLAAVDDVRQRLDQFVNPNLIRQEAYDMSLEEIRDRMTNPGVFFDPRIFFRAVEEILRINVFIFVPIKYKSIGLKSEIISGELETPRYLLFQVRYINPDRPCALVYMHWGTESDGLSVPQCELIGDINHKVEYPPSITRFMIGVSERAYPHYNWTRLPSGELEMCVYPSSLVNPIIHQLHLKTFKAVNQLIDAAGKMRAITLDFGSYQATVLTPPAQPQNLPLADRITEAPLESVAGWLQIEAYSRENDHIVGAWGQIRGEVKACTGDIQDLLYVPLVPIDLKENQPWPEDAPSPADVEERGSPEKAYLSVQPEESVDPITSELEWKIRTFQIFIILMRWLFLIDPSKTTVSIFDDYFTVGDPDLIYDFSRIRPRLPAVQTISEALAWLEEQKTGVVANGKVVLPNRELLSKLWVHFNTYRTNFSLPRILPIYQYLRDFDRQPGVRIFISISDLLDWAQSNKNKSTTVLRKAIDPGRIGEVPYVVITPTQNYLVQYVKDGVFERAIWVAYTWYNWHINKGYNAEYPRAIPTVRPRVLIAVSTGGFITEREGVPVSGGLLTLLRTKANEYAAMLPLGGGRVPDYDDLIGSEYSIIGDDYGDVNSPAHRRLDYRGVEREEVMDQVVSAPGEIFGDDDDDDLYDPELEGKWNDDLIIDELNREGEWREEREDVDVVGIGNPNIKELQSE